MTPTSCPREIPHFSCPSDSESAGPSLSSLLPAVTWSCSFPRSESGSSPLDHLTADPGRSPWAAPLTAFEMNEGASPHSAPKMCPHTFSHFVLRLHIFSFSLDPQGQGVCMFLCNLLCGDFVSPSLWNWWLYDHHCNWNFSLNTWCTASY